MSKPLKLSINEARRFLLSCQQLWPPARGIGKEGVMAYIKQVGSIQFDPLNIAGRSPELVLHARIKNYTSLMLDELLYKERRLIDGMDKVMCIYPVKDRPYFRREKKEYLKWIKSHSRGTPLQPFFSQTLKVIKKQGALSSKELNLPGKVDWSWAPTSLPRAVLDALYRSGQLGIHHKQGTRKYYDLLSRLISDDILKAPEPLPREKDYNKWRILRRIGGVGFLWAKPGDAWLGTCKTPQRREAIIALQKEGLIGVAEVEGIRESFFFRTEDQSHFEVKPDKRGGAVIPPLDNLLWDRKMVEALFNFSYRWEVYKPAAEREYGYYVLPLLYGNRFVARFEPETDREFLRIKNWWWEKGVSPSESMLKTLKKILNRLCRFLGKKGIALSQKNNDKLSWLISDDY